jgi:hypothetical protein
MPFNIGHWIVTYELKQMGRYLDLLYIAIQDNQKHFYESIEQIARDMTTEEKEEFYQFHEDDFIEASRDFPRLLFSSFVVSWYSFTESHLINFCKGRNLEIALSIQDNEHYGKGIRRAYTFLDRAANYKIDNIHWQELKHIGKTRNRLVHENGRLTYSHVNNSPKNNVPVKALDQETVYLHVDSDLHRYLQAHNLIEFTGLFYYITPNFDYCKHLVDFGMEFFVKLYKDFSID